MNEELFKKSIINIINKNEQKLSAGCIYYILKDILFQMETEYKRIAEKEYEDFLNQQQQKQEEVKE